MPNISTAEKLIEPSMELEIPLPPTDLPLEDGIPLETNQHRIAMNVLIQSLKHAWAERTDFFVGGNMFVYFSTLQLYERIFKTPNYFVFDPFDAKSLRGWHFKNRRCQKNCNYGWAFGKERWNESRGNGYASTIRRGN